MVHEDWDSAPRRVYGPNFTSDLIRESPIFSSARDRFLGPKWLIGCSRPRGESFVFSCYHVPQ